MQVYKRTWFSMVKGIVIAPFGGLLVFFLGQVLLPLWVCAILGLVVVGAVVYIAIISENIYFELDDNGAFRYYQKGVMRNSFELSTCRIGYNRKTEGGILGNNDIRLQIIDEKDEKNEETFIDSGPLGIDQFDEMFVAMQKYAIQEAEVLNAEKKRG